MPIVSRKLNNFVMHRVEGVKVLPVAIYGLANLLSSKYLLFICIAMSVVKRGTFYHALSSSYSSISVSLVVTLTSMFIIKTFVCHKCTS